MGYRPARSHTDPCSPALELGWARWKASHREQWKNLGSKLNRFLIGRPWGGAAPRSGRAISWIWYSRYSGDQVLGVELDGHDDDGATIA